MHLYKHHNLSGISKFKPEMITIIKIIIIKINHNGASMHSTEAEDMEMFFHDLCQQLYNILKVFEYEFNL